MPGWIHEYLDEIKCSNFKKHFKQYKLTSIRYTPTDMFLWREDNAPFSEHTCFHYQVIIAINNVIHCCTLHKVVPFYLVHIPSQWRRYRAWEKKDDQRDKKMIQPPPPPLPPSFPFCFLTFYPPITFPVSPWRHIAPSILSRSPGPIRNATTTLNLYDEEKKKQWRYEHYS